MRGGLAASRCYAITARKATDGSDAGAGDACAMPPPHAAVAMPHVELWGVPHYVRTHGYTDLTRIEMQGFFERRPEDVCPATL